LLVITSLLHGRDRDKIDDKEVKEQQELEAKISGERRSFTTNLLFYASDRIRRGVRRPKDSRN
jgi:hypothetical protein